MHAHIPLISFRFNVSKPWYHRSLRTLQNKKKRLFKTAKRLNTPASWSKQKSCETAYCRAVRKAKNKFFSHDLQSLMTNNPKKFWRAISPTSTPTNVALQDGNGNLIEEEKCADVLNKYFTSVFTKEDCSNIPTITDVTYRYMNRIQLTVEGIASVIKKT